LWESGVLKLIHRLMVHCLSKTKNAKIFDELYLRFFCLKIKAQPTGTECRVIKLFSSQSQMTPISRIQRKLIQGKGLYK
jgi:hypothetical protein